MVTNYPQQLAASAGVMQADASGMFARAVARVGQLLCGAKGHDCVLHFEGNRVMMRCTSCGHDSPGWEISGHGPRKRFEGDARRHSMRVEHLTLRKTA